VLLNKNPLGKGDFNFFGKKTKRVFSLTEARARVEGQNKKRISSGYCLSHHQQNNLGGFLVPGGDLSLVDVRDWPTFIPSPDAAEGLSFPLYYFNFKLICKKYVAYCYGFGLYAVDFCGF
jgi:hypothetical protein